MSLRCLTPPGIVSVVIRYGVSAVFAGESRHCGEWSVRARLGSESSPGAGRVSETRRRSSEWRTCHAGAKWSDGGIRWDGCRHGLEYVTLTPSNIYRCLPTVARSSSESNG